MEAYFQGEREALLVVDHPRVDIRGTSSCTLEDIYWLARAIVALDHFVERHLVWQPTTTWIKDLLIL